MIQKPLHSRLSIFAAACLAATASGAERREVPPAARIDPGASIDLFSIWPEIAGAPVSRLGTIECVIKPDAAAVRRNRAFLITLSNRAGADTAGLSLTMKQGVVRANVFGAYLDAGRALKARQWAHVALTINSETINTQARLWIGGELAAEELVLEPWPASFEVAEMLSDKWGQGRVFSGELGDVRISDVVKYQSSFPAPRRLPRDGDTVLLLEGGRVTPAD